MSFEASISALVVNARVGINPVEILDFILGFTTVDIAGDDEQEIPFGLRNHISKGIVGILIHHIARSIHNLHNTPQPICNVIVSIPARSMLIGSSIPGPWL